MNEGGNTVPGFPGYCSESFPGQSCNVVCDFGRNNVPLCQVRAVKEFRHVESIFCIILALSATARLLNGRKVYKV
jgi:hypothetical protein